MDIAKVLVQLRAELDILNAAISSLERLQHQGPRKRASENRRSTRRHAARRDSVRTVTGIRKAE
jgi:hypothetical protein